MSVNSTEVSYAFGQMGSIHAAGTEFVTSNLVVASGMKANEAVFVAITFLEDTVFNSDNEGLVSASDQLYPSSQYTSTDIDSDGGDVVNSEIFPAGVTIYGRWTGFKLSSGRVIAYIGY